MVSTGAFFHNYLSRLEGSENTPEVEGKFFLFLGVFLQKFQIYLRKHITTSSEFHALTKDDIENNLTYLRNNLAILKEELSIVEALDAEARVDFFVKKQKEKTKNLQRIANSKQKEIEAALDLEQVLSFFVDQEIAASANFLNNLTHECSGFAEAAIVEIEKLTQKVKEVSEQKMESFAADYLEKLKKEVAAAEAEYAMSESLLEQKFEIISEIKQYIL